MGAACGWCVGFGFRSLVVSSSVRDPRCWFLVCWCCFGCVGSACPACVALCCSALPCVRFVCSGRDELIVQLYVNMSRGRRDDLPRPRSRTRMQERKVCQVGVWDSGSPLWGLRVDSCPTVLEVEVMSGPGWAI